MSSYANEGARNLAILSFTSTLSAFCTIATAATFELPLIYIISFLYSVVQEVVVVSTFPTHASMGNIGRRITKWPWTLFNDRRVQGVRSLSLMNTPWAQGLMWPSG
jgi:hypothetical protein